jgi:hypothetical protein
MTYRWPLLVATLISATASLGCAYAEDGVLIEQVKTTWRAQDGTTIDDIVSRAAEVAHFVPTGWDTGKTHNSEDFVTLSWARSQSDMRDDEHEITWDISASGVMSLGPARAKTVELGWRPFALSLIAREAADEYPQPNLAFLRDVSNYGFVVTAQGGLGELLREGRCKIGTPVSLDYVVLPEKMSKDDLWRLQLLVDCDIPGPSYFTHSGIIIFTKMNHGAWQPASFFARRIAKYPPGHWFAEVEPDEQKTFDAVRKALKGGK